MLNNLCPNVCQNRHTSSIKNGKFDYLFLDLEVLAWERR